MRGYCRYLQYNLQMIGNLALKEQVGSLHIHCRYGCRSILDGRNSPKYLEIDPGGCPMKIKLSERKYAYFYCSLEENTSSNYFSPKCRCCVIPVSPLQDALFYFVLVSLLRRPQVPIVNAFCPGNLYRKIEVIKSRKGIYHLRVKTQVQMIKLLHCIPVFLQRSYHRLLISHLIWSLDTGQDRAYTRSVWISDDSAYKSSN